jgi:glycosyltransferase involved in cell wall biosynthesis
MRIVLANNYYYLRGGSERVLYDDRDALVAAGHEVLPFAPRDERNDPAASAAYFPTVTDHTKAGGAGAFKAASNVIYSRTVGRAFAAFLDDFRPDLIHCHNIYGRLTTAVLDEARRRGVPVVLTVHDLKLVCPAYLGLRQGKPCMLCKDGGYWRCVRYKCHKQSSAASLVYAIEAYFNRSTRKYDAVSQFLCPSRFMQQALIDAGIQAERAVYLPNALESARYAPCFEPGDYVLYAGRISAEKGILTLLEAVERTGIPLRIAGAGPLDVLVRSRIAERQLPVQMEGYCSGERLADLYRRAAFVVIPSEWYENASMSALEAFAYGKPVLASRIGGNPELIVASESGCLFTPGDANELTSAASSMWANRTDLVRMGQRARSLIEQKFAQEKRLTNMLEIYRGVCGQSASPQ